MTQSIQLPDFHWPVVVYFEFPKKIQRFLGRSTTAGGYVVLAGSDHFGSPQWTQCFVRGLLNRSVRKNGLPHWGHGKPVIRTPEIEKRTKKTAPIRTGAISEPVICCKGNPRTSSTGKIPSHDAKKNPRRLRYSSQESLIPGAP